MKTKDKILEQIRLGNARATGIAKLLKITPASVSRHVSNLIQEGLVVKAGRDYKPGNAVTTSTPPPAGNDVALTQKLEWMLAILPAEVRKTLLSELITKSESQNRTIHFSTLVKTYGGVPFDVLSGIEDAGHDTAANIAEAIWTQLGIPVVVSSTPRVNLNEGTQP